MNIFRNFLRWIKGNQVYALVGASGTGKSFRAQLVAQQYRIDLIIDDGLLIRDDTILAGRSAKQEPSFLKAVKVAVFDDKQHRDSVAKVLQKMPKKKILLLGTSEKMVNKIAVRLQIRPPQKIIHIEDIATKKEIETALRSRKVEGTHVIPAPSLAVQHSYAHIFYDSIRLLFHHRKKGNLSQKKLFEKSVVRPQFSVLDKVSISNDALETLLLEIIAEYDATISIKKITIHREQNVGYKIVMLIDVPFAKELTVQIEQLRDHLISVIESRSGILIKEINIVIDKIIDLKSNQEA